MKRFLCVALLAATCAERVLAQAAPLSDDIPVAPIMPVEYHGVTNVYRLSNPEMDALIVPSIGRIARIGFGGMENILRSDSNLIEQSVSETPSTDWRNFGGDWLWPVAQARWTKHFGREWPPPELFDRRPWSGTAWVNADGTRTCLIEQDVGEPLNIHVSRRITLDAQLAQLTIRQHIERIAASTIPVCLWTISQVQDADQILIPIDDRSLLHKGFTSLGFSPIPEELISNCESAAVFNVKGGTEHKLGADSTRGWVAALRGHVLIVEHASGLDDDGAFPDGGSRDEMYSNKGMGYTEIETLSAEKELLPSESLVNTLQISCYRLSESLEPCDLATRVRTLLGEIKPDDAPAR